MERGVEIKADECGRALFCPKPYAEIGGQENDIIPGQDRTTGFSSDKYGRISFQKKEQCMAVLGPDFQIGSLLYGVEFGQSG